MKYITETDWSYWVRFLKGTDSDQNAIKQKSFAFSKYGGKRKAKKAAIIYRDKHRAAHEMQVGFRGGNWLKGKYFSKTKINNTSGVTGVHFKLSYGRNGILYSGVWVATWVQNGKNKRKSFAFPIAQTGNKQFKLAVKHRKDMEKLHCTTDASKSR